MYKTIDDAFNPAFAIEKSIASLTTVRQTCLTAVRPKFLQTTRISSIFLLTVGVATLSKKNLAGIPVFIGLSTLITIATAKSGFKFLLLFLLLCETSFSQTPSCRLPSSITEKIKLNEFKKIDSIQLGITSVNVIGYTAYLAYGLDNEGNADSVKQDAIMVKVTGSSLKDPKFLAAFNKFSPPFFIILDDIKAIGPDNKIRTICCRSIWIL